VFFNRLTEDKVIAAFLFAPASFAAACWLLEGASRRCVWLVFLCYLALLFAHPTIFGVACLVTVGTSAGWWFDRRSRGGILRLVCLTTALAAAATLLRLAPHASQSRIHFTVEAADEAGELTRFRAKRLSLHGGSGFYAVSRRALPRGEVIVGAAVFALALATLRRERAAGFVAGSLAVAALAAFPQTGWLIGSLITPFHLWRVLWLVPFGISLALFVRVGGRVMAVTTSWGTRRPFALLVGVLELASIWFLANLAQTTGRRLLASVNVPPDWRSMHYVEREIRRGRPSCPRDYRDLSAIGEWIDEQAPHGATVAGDVSSRTNELIPSVSANARLVAFRNPWATAREAAVSPDVASSRFRTLQRLTEPATPASERIRLLSRSGLDYVVLCGPSRWRWAQDLAREHPQRISLALVRGEFRVYRILPSP
jgi:hypothetical protein